MGWWSDFTGKTGADAAKAAAADTYGKQQSAIARLLGYGDELKAGYDNMGASYQAGKGSPSRAIASSASARSAAVSIPDTACVGGSTSIVAMVRPPSRKRSCSRPSSFS